MSTIRPWRIVKGFSVPRMACCLTLSVTEVMVALSGMMLVLKDRMLRYCFFDASSPTRRVWAVLSSVPPMPLVSAVSRVQPSSTPREPKVMVTMLGVRVRVTVLVAVAVAVIVTVGDGVKVDVAVDVLV